VKFSVPGRISLGGAADGFWLLSNSDSMVRIDIPSVVGLRRYMAVLKPKTKPSSSQTRANRRLTGSELALIFEETRLAETPSERSRLQKEFMRGFYGDKRGDLMPKIRRGNLPPALLAHLWRWIRVWRWILQSSGNESVVSSDLIKVLHGDSSRVS
jgi:hypothetical protein